MKKNFKIPHGVTIFGVGAGASYLGLAHKKNKELNKAYSDLQQEITEVKSELQDLKNQTVIEQNETIVEQNKTILENINALKDKIENAINNNNNNNFIPNSDDINNIFNIGIDYYNQYFDFLNSFNLHQQMFIYNIIFSFFILSLLFDYLGGLYANYLIEKFELNTKYPKIAKLLKYRLQYQKYYFKYLTFLAVSILIFNIVFNIYLFLLYQI